MPTRTIDIQQYNGAKDNKGKQTTTDEAIKLIKSDKQLRLVIEELRRYLSDGQKDKYDKSKSYLPAVTWSGTFEKRLKTKLTEYSGLICIDIDKLGEEIYPLKEKLKADKYTWFLFTSPSGSGLKLIVSVDGGADKHLENFLALEKYYKHEYSITIDQSGKDVCRLCYLGYDSDCYHNPSSLPFHYSSMAAIEKPVLVPVKKETVKIKSIQQDFETFDANSLDAIFEFTKKGNYQGSPIGDYSEGKRNVFIFVFAANCNRKGISQSECENYVFMFANDLDPAEIHTAVTSAYKSSANETGKYIKRQTNARKDKNVSAKSGNANSKDSIHLKDEDDYIKFWFQTEDKKSTDEEGKPMIKYHIVYNKLIWFLQDAGFFRYSLPNNTYQFIHYAGSICSTAQLINMKDTVISFLENKKLYGVLESIRRGSKQYFSVQVLEGLKYKEVQLKRDTPNEAYFYFKNCYVRVTKDNIETFPLDQLEGSVWKTSIIDRDFSLQKLVMPVNNETGLFELDKWECEMAKFIALVSHSPESKEDITPEEIGDRFMSICTSIGYMLHGYKNNMGKAIVAVDHKVPEDKTEQNGGSGKTIVGTSFKYLKKLATIDGRKFDDKEKFCFDVVDIDTKVVSMVDCRTNLDFGFFFNALTGDFTFRKMYLGSITIPFEDSNKWWFDTNFVFKGEGSSFRRRMHIIEFDDYFDENYTPFDEFGHSLFTDWDADQWNQFYNFYFSCIQMYLSSGLIAYPKSNYESRKLLVEAPHEFIDFMDAVKDDGINKGKHIVQRNHEIKKLDIIKLWNEYSAELNMTKCTPHQFFKWSMKYFISNNLKLIRRKSGGIEYWTIADENYQKDKNNQETLPFKN